MHCTKISTEFECQGQRSRSLRTKDEKVHYFFGSRPLGRSPRVAFSLGAFLRVGGVGGVNK